MEIDGFGFIKNKTYQPSVEVLFKNKFGLELELGFLNSDFSVPPTQFNNLSTSQKFSRKRFRPSVAGKYYFLFNKNSNGFYAGPYFRLNFLSELEDGAADAWKAAFNLSEDAIKSAGFEEGLTGISYGVNLGYKWVVFSHLVIEPAYVFTAFNKLNSEEKGGANYSEGEMFIRIGYRF